MSDFLKEKKSIRFIALNLFILFASVYLLTASGVNAYHTDVGKLRIEVVKSIIERSDLSVPDGIGIKGSDGREYSWFGIGSALLIVPFYIVVKLTGILPEIAVSIINQLFGAGTAVLLFIFLISLGYSRRSSFITTIFYGFGTMAWPISKQPFDHIIETFFILLSIYCIYLYISNRKTPNLLFSAFSLGFAFITRSTSILVIFPLIILIFVSYKKMFNFQTSLKMLIQDIIFFFIAFLPFLAISFWYNYYRFGSIFETGYSLMAMRLGIDFFSGTPLFTGLSGFLISPVKGFFFYSPVAILFFFSIKSFMKKHPDLGISFILIIISYLLFLSRNIYWHGDWAWGPRYIFVLTPFIIMPLAELFDSRMLLKKKFLRSIVYSFFVISLIIQIAAVSVDYRKYFINLRVVERSKFIEVNGEGVQPIIEPQAETYFSWYRSPILAQFNYVYQISKNLRDYRYSEFKEHAMPIDQVKVSPYVNVFDFWWVYKYYLDRSYSGFIGALAILLIAIFSVVKLRSLLRNTEGSRYVGKN